MIDDPIAYFWPFFVFWLTEFWVLMIYSAVFGWLELIKLHWKLNSGNLQALDKSQVKNRNKQDCTKMFFLTT